MVNGTKGRSLTLGIAVLAVLVSAMIALIPAWLKGADVGGLVELEHILVGLLVGALVVNPGPPKPPDGGDGRK